MHITAKDLCTKINMHVAQQKYKHKSVNTLSSPLFGRLLEYLV